MSSPFEQPISSLTADLTKEQDVSLADLNSQVSAIAKEIKRSNRHPDAVKEALRLVGKMHVIYENQNEHGRTVYEVETKGLGLINEPCMINDFFVFTSKNKNFEPSYIFDHLGNKIESGTKFKYVAEPRQIGNNQSAFVAVDENNYWGILLYDGKKSKIIKPKTKAFSVHLPNDIPEGNLIFIKREDPNSSRTYSLLDDKGEILDPEASTGDAFGPFRNFNGEIYYTVVNALPGGRTQESIKTFNLQDPNIPHFDGEIFDHVVDIFALPDAYDSTEKKTVYAQVKKHYGKYCFVDGKGIYLTFPESEDIAEMIHSGSNVSSSRRYAKIKNDSRWFVYNDHGDVIGDEKGYLDIQHFKSIDHRTFFCAKLDDGSWTVIKDNCKISSSAFKDIAELTVINNEAYFISAFSNYKSSESAIFSQRGHRISPHYLNIKHLIEASGLPAYCAQENEESKWRVYNSQSQPCTRKFDEIYSLQPGTKNDSARVLGRIGTKYVMELVDLNKEYFEPSQADSE